MVKLVFSFIIFISSLSMLAFEGLIDFDSPPTKFNPTKVNLALRRSVHELLRSAGDSLSQIKPINQVNDSTFKVLIESNFDYDLLPKILDESFKMHQIESNYDVSVLNCRTSVIELGYSYFDFSKNGEVPCTGRSKTDKCYTLQVSFLNNPPKKSTKWLWILPVLGFISAGLLFRFSKKKTQIEPKSDDFINFGNSKFSFEKLSLISTTQSHQLTYREAKLLKLFVENQNQVLERDFILKSVWEDEGIIVGRSIDVFVSRLRKLLQSDSTLQITTVHGIGYKLMVN
jgi:Transcriptional regulatory protein, C terminal